MILRRNIVEEYNDVFRIVRDHVQVPFPWYIYAYFPLENNEVDEH
jgi:hypothetical protein